MKTNRVIPGRGASPWQSFSCARWVLVIEVIIQEEVPVASICVIVSVW